MIMKETNTENVLKKLASDAKYRLKHCNYNNKQENLNIKRNITVIFVSKIISKNEVSKVFKLNLRSYDHPATSMITASSMNHLPSSS